MILRRLKLDQIIVCEENSQTLFFGDYDLFLEKMGWEEDKKTSVPKQASAPAPARAPPIKKTSNKNIRECEKKIIALEEAQAEAQKVMSSGKCSPELLKSFGQRQKEIERLYEELEALSRPD